MPAEDPSIGRFLSTIYPYMHMKLYNALRENEKLRNEIPNIIEDLIKNPEKGRRDLKLQAKEYPNSLTSHALRILANLSEKGNNAILAQFEKGISKFDIADPVEGIILQAVISDRWLKHACDSAFDLIIALPDLSRVIAISTTEAEIVIDPIIPRLTKVRLEKAHLYSFFNRAHAVKGRRVATSENKNGNVVGDKQLKPFIRTCSDAESIGRGTNLSFFTPFLTNNGLKLGFFFALICRVNSVEPVCSPEGIGITLDQVDLILYDFSGCLKARLSTEIFIESMENPSQQDGLKLDDPFDLKNVSRAIWVVGAWILGQDFPEVLFLGLPKDDLGTEIWEVLAFMNSRRKVSYAYLVDVLSKDVVERACRETNNLLKIREWVYYIEDGWPKEIFLALEKNGFPHTLTLPDALEFGASYWVYKYWSNRILRFLRINPHILEHYRSMEPLNSDNEKVYKLTHESGKTTSDTVLASEANKVKLVQSPTKSSFRKTEIGLRCPVCGLNSIVREVSAADGYYVEFCQGVVSAAKKNGESVKAPCNYWGSGWIST